eukprot:m.750739 g.750739  ORF g.750739 m.750739 type:complete len:218 (+) comp58982_c0_seq10:972-1625(+)
MQACQTTCPSSFKLKSRFIAVLSVQLSPLSKPFMVSLLIANVVMEVNYFGVTRTCRAFLPLLRHDHGRIINIGSVLGLLPMANHSSYCASKFALEGLTHVLRQELSPLGVSVSMVNPAQIKTAIFDKLVAEMEKYPPSEEARQTYPALYKSPAEIKQQLDAVTDTVDLTNTAILHAVTSEYPQTRYIVGNVGFLPMRFIVPLVSCLPTRLVDSLAAH